MDCSCVEFCARWGKSKDGSYEFWCPMVPKGFKEYGIDCKLHTGKDTNMKQKIIPNSA